MSMRRLGVSLAVGAMLLAHAVAASAQTNQIRPRVMIMVDTSGSMLEHFGDTNSAGGDGSTFYQDSLLTRSFATDKNLGLYPGFSLQATNQCTMPATSLSSYDGVNSRMYAAKQAVQNVVFGSGGIDWGLMRYTGNDCAMVSGTVTDLGTVCATAGDCAADTQHDYCTGTTCKRNLAFAPHRCGTSNSNCGVGNGRGNCQKGVCACTTDDQCDQGEFCVGGICGADLN